MWEVSLGTDDDAWYGVESAEGDDLVVHDLNHVERFAGGDGVHEDVTVNANGMLGVEDSVLVLGERRDEGRVVVVGDESV